MKSKIDIDNKIDAYIKENENGDITATQLNEVLKEINAALFEFINNYTEQLAAIANRVSALENGGGETPDVPTEDIYALSGSFSYSGNIAASGGTKTPTNTLGITKNGVAVSGVTITYSSNQSYATVDSTGKVTFTSHTNTSTRTATITATVTDGTHTYTKTANVTQSAYVAPTETLTYYADIKTLSAGGSAGISDVTSPSSYTNGTFNYTVPAKGNTVILLCPSSKSLQSCIKQGEILDNITAELNSSVTNVTYNSKSYKMYQFRYAANIQGEKFEVKFN